MSSKPDNPYEVLQLPFEASHAEIKKSYRVLALKYHPDKDPSPLAAEMFEKVTQAHRLLTNEVAKASFDSLYKLEIAAKLRDEKMNSERRKAKEDLEGKEQLAKRSKSDLQDAQRKFEAEVQRIRDENARHIFEEQQRLRQYMAQQVPTPTPTPVESSASLQLRWDGSGDDNGGYSADVLRKIFVKYGQVDVLMSKKSGRAVIAFTKESDALFAKKHEVGLSNNPFTKLSLVDGDTSTSTSQAPTPPPPQSSTPTPTFPSKFSQPAVQISSKSTTDDDFEQAVLARLMQAHKNKTAQST